MRKAILNGDDYDKINAKWPSISEEEYNIFKDEQGLASTKALSLWGKKMHGKNLGPHNLGCRGYDRAGPVWEKQDRERTGPDPYAKIKDPMARRYIRAHYREDPKNQGQLALNATIKELEKDTEIEE